LSLFHALRKKPFWNESAARGTRIFTKETWINGFSLIRQQTQSAKYDDNVASTVFDPQDVRWSDGGKIQDPTAVKA
jgi:hypothetical protein